LNDVLAGFQNLSPQSQAARAWAQMEMRPATADGVKAIVPESSLGHLLAWEWLARQSPDAVKNPPPAARPLSLVGTALGSLK
jgi:hypothetical protein